MIADFKRMIIFPSDTIEDRRGTVAFFAVTVYEIYFTVC